MSNATFSIVCYKSKTLANGEHPLMLRVCKDGKKIYRSLGISVNPKHWSFSKNAPKASCPNREQILKIIIAKQAELQSRVLTLNSEQRDYTASTLLKSQSDHFTPKTVEEFYVELIEEYAEVITDIPQREKKTLPFIEANTKAVELSHLKNECIVPVFSKDNELTISHPAFIETVAEAVSTFYNGETGSSRNGGAYVKLSRREC